MPTIAMVHIPAGKYRPFFKRTARRGTGLSRRSANPSANRAPILVLAFKLDSAPVTRADYLAFVCRHPEWRKSRVKALFAEATYLSDWHGDLDPDIDRLREPVTNVSWFAARAYCAARSARLPTVFEWERVAGESVADDAASPMLPDARMPLRFAMGRAAHDLRSVRLVFPGLWEWNVDFNSTLVASGSTQPGIPSSLFCGDGYRATNARDYGAFLRHSFRTSLRANYALKNLGFRCATGE